MKFKIIKVIFFSFIFLNSNIFAMEKDEPASLESVKVGIASNYLSVQAKAINNLRKLIQAKNKKAYSLAKDVAIKFVNNHDPKIQDALRDMIYYGFKSLVNNLVGKKTEQEEPAVDANIIAATFVLIKSNIETEFFGGKEKKVKTEALDFCRAMFVSGQAIVEATALAKSLLSEKELEEKKLGLELLYVLVRYAGSAYEVAKDTIIALSDNEQLSKELIKLVAGFVERVSIFQDGGAYYILRNELLIDAIFFKRLNKKGTYEENLKKWNETLQFAEPIILWKEYAQEHLQLDKGKTWEDEAYNFKVWTYDVYASQGFIYYKNKEREKLEEEKREELKKQIEECKGMKGSVDQASRYKIHLQVKQEYLFEFVSSLFKELENPKLSNICIFKFTYEFQNNRHKVKSEGGKAVPIIVLYVTESVDLLDNEKRNNIIDPMLQEIVRFVDVFCKQHKPEITIQDLAWPVTARFNKKINDVVYIAGGDADDKPVPSVEDDAEYLVTGKYKWTRGYVGYIGDVEYSDDLCFVKGHEYLTPEEVEAAAALAQAKEEAKKLEAERKEEAEAKAQEAEAKEKEKQAKEAKAEEEKAERLRKEQAEAEAKAKEEAEVIEAEKEKLKLEEEKKKKGEESAVALAQAKEEANAKEEAKAQKEFTRKLQELQESEKVNPVQISDLDFIKDDKYNAIRLEGEDIKLIELIPNIIKNFCKKLDEQDDASLKSLIDLLENIKTKNFFNKDQKKKLSDYEQSIKMWRLHLKPIYALKDRAGVPLTKLKESLGGLKAKLQALTGKLGSLKKTLEQAIL